MRENFSRKDMKDFAEWCRNGLLNTEYSFRNLDTILSDWEEQQEKIHGRIIEDGFGGRWSATCPKCMRDKMQIVRPGKVQCSVCG